MTPTRTVTNHRLYSERDVRRLALLRQATLQGQSISLIAKLPLEELESLVGPGEATTYGPLRPNQGTPVSDDTSEQTVDNCLRAVEQLDRNALETYLGRASTTNSLHVLLDRIIGPLMEHIGERWRTGELRPAHEHMATDTVRAFLSSRRAIHGINASAPVIVVTTPAGQSHEVGALMVSLVACADGWRDVYLGPNLPAEDIVAAVVASGAKALALSIVYPSDDPNLAAELVFLQHHLPKETRVFIGGRAAEGYASAIQRLGAAPYIVISDFRDALERARSESTSSASP